MYKILIFTLKKSLDQMLYIHRFESGECGSYKIGEFRTIKSEVSFGTPSITKHSVNN